MPTSQQNLQVHPHDTPDAGHTVNTVPGRTRGRERLSALGNAISIVLLSVSVLAALVLIVVPFATGSHTYSVLTNSMAPAYPPGTFIVVRPTEFEEIRRGDAVTYQLHSGQPEVMTHRVISTTSGQDGERLLITQGDNNDLPDPEPVRQVQLRGELWYAVPYVGFLANALGHTDRGMAVNVIAVLLIAGGVITMARGMAASRKTKRTGTTAEQPCPGTETAAEQTEAEGTEDPVHGRQHTNLGVRP